MGRTENGRFALLPHGRCSQAAAASSSSRISESSAASDRKPSRKVGSIVLRSPRVGLIVLVALLGVSTAATNALAQYGTGTDIYWAQTNGNPTASANGGSSSDPTGFSVDGLWNDTLSTGYASPNNVPAGTFPSINWSTSSAGSAVPATPPGSYPARRRIRPIPGISLAVRAIRTWTSFSMRPTAITARPTCGSTIRRRSGACTSTTSAPRHR